MSDDVGPNVLLVITDQQRWDTLGCYGNDIIESVNLDWLAEEGTVFTKAYSATPSCVPARASLMTGMDPWHTGILGMGPHDPPCANLPNTLPTVLSAAGYHTQGVGKMHFTPQRSLQGFHHTVLDESARVRDPGFISDYARWFELNKDADVGRYDHGIDQNSWLARPFHLPEFLHATTWTATESIRFLQRRDPTLPFFLKTSFARPHSPYDPPAVYYNRYDTMRLPAPAVGEWAVRHDDRRGATDPNARRGRLSRRDIQRARAGYFGAINHIDHQLGRIMRFLREERLDEQTMVVFTSDHGDMLGDHHLWRKTRPYEGSVHIPMIVRLPTSMRGGVRRRVDAPVCLQDVMPTILDVVGVPAPATVDGASMLPLMSGDHAPCRPFIHGEQSRAPQAVAMHYLVDDTWKYIWFPDEEREQLFRLADDPYELRNLAGNAALQAEQRRLRQSLVGVLEKRQVGLTDGRDLVCQRGRPPVTSPHARERRASGSRTQLEEAWG